MDISSFKNIGKMPMTPSSPQEPMAPTGEQSPMPPATPEAGAMPPMPGMGSINPMEGGQMTTAPMSSEQMRADLQKDLSGLDERENQVRGNIKMGTEVLIRLRTDIVKSVLKIMQDNGVDLKNQDSINEFLDSLYQKDMDLYFMFSDALENILADDGSINPPEGGEENQEMGEEQDMQDATQPGKIPQVPEAAQEIPEGEQQPAAPIPPAPGEMGEVEPQMQ